MFWKNDHISPKISLTSMTLIVAILTLMIILVFYSYRQIVREQERGMIELSLKGTTLISSLVAGARVGMMGMMWSQEHLQTLLEEAARDPEVLYLIIANEEGQMIVHSQREQVGTLLERDEALRQAFEQGRTTTILRQETGRGKVFEIVSPFQPLAIDQESARRMERMIQMMQMMHRRSSQSFPPSNLAIKVGLSLKKVDQALRNEVIKALGMGTFCFVGGSAVLYMILLAQNYTSVKRTLREMRTYTQHILDSMGDGLISLNTQGEIVTINPSACQLLSLQENEVKGKHFTELFREDHLDIASLLASGRKSIAHEVDWTTPAGQTISLSLSAAPIQEDDGKIMGAVLLLRDLRELKAMQRRVERTERLASLGRLAAGVAHEIRNPLSSIKGLAQYFRGQFKGQPDQQAYASIIVQEVDRLNRVISDLLEFAKPREPLLESQLLQDVLHHALILIGPDAAAKGIKVVEEIDEIVPSILLDRDQFTQALLNILLNAIESMGEGGILTCSLHCEDGVERWLALLITDTGSGIPPEDLPKIFDPFFTTKKRGTGLGLAIAQQIIEGHGGEIRVESQIGQGTTFAITLPIKENPQI